MLAVERKKAVFKIAGLTPDQIKIAEDTGKNEGKETVRMSLWEATERRLDPLVLTTERLLTQSREILSISLEADAIEAHFQENSLPLPSWYAILTGGFDPPQNRSQVIGHCGQGDFSGLYQSGIKGQGGEVILTDLGKNQSLMTWKFRTHPYDLFDPMASAHNARVVKELIRRGNTEGRYGGVITAYLCGVDFKTDSLNSGDLGVLLDDSAWSRTHPGLGPREIINDYDGPQFGAKAGRSSHPDLVREFIEICRRENLSIAPAAMVSTPGDTEYQSGIERALLEIGFEAALKMELLDKIVRPLFGGGWREQIALLFGMGPTDELAVFRSTFKDESQIPVLALGLATDEVGSRQSLRVDHDAIFAKAMQEAPKYIPSIFELAAHFSQGEPYQRFPDFTIKTKLKALGVYK